MRDSYRHQTIGHQYPPIALQICLLVRVILNTVQGLAPTETCMQCGETVPMHQLQQHIESGSHAQKYGVY